MDERARFNRNLTKLNLKNHLFIKKSKQLCSTLEYKFAVVGHFLEFKKVLIGARNIGLLMSAVPNIALDSLRLRASAQGICYFRRLHVISKHCTRCVRCVCARDGSSPTTPRARRPPSFNPHLWSGRSQFCFSTQQREPFFYSPRGWR